MSTLDGMTPVCPYDPQCLKCEFIVTMLIKAAQAVCTAPRGVDTHLELIYWKGVLLARDAHIYPSVLVGAVVRRKDGAGPVAPLTTNVLRFETAIDDDLERKVVRVFYIPHLGWHLQLDGEECRIFAEDQFDLVLFNNT